MKPTRIALLFGAISAIGASVAFAAPRAARTVSELDKSFVENAGQAGMAEVKLGELASQKSESPAVKTFSERIVKDHTAANEKLASIAKGLGLTMPIEVNSKQRATYDRLNGLSGAAFDRAFYKTMVQDHHAAISLFQKEARQGSDSSLKQFASETLPTLKEHLALTKTLPR